MRIAIIVFSPSGHTLKVAQMIEEQCKQHLASVRLIDITRKNKFLFDDNRQQNLITALGKYDLLFIGGPVYAGHMESNILKTIELLPAPDDTYSNLVVPFLTYGGAHSSIALEETGALLREKKYKSILGIKIVATHTLTKNFAKVMNPDKPSNEEKELIRKAIDYIFETIKKGNITDQSKAFEYSPQKERELFHSFKQENIHKKHKTVDINQEKCIKCKKCINVCPVNVLGFDKNGRVVNKNKDRCILCAECFYVCPTEAINYSYFEKAKERLQNGFVTQEKELSRVYPNCIKNK